MHRGDPISVVESAYDFAHDDEAWLTSIVKAAEPLGLGTGVYAFTCDLREPGDPKIGVMVGAGSTTDEMLGRASLEAMPPDIFTRMFGPGPLVGLASDKLRPLPDFIQQAVKGYWAQRGVADHIGVKGWNPSGEAVLLGFAIDKPMRLAPRVSSILSRIAVHLSAGMRLRRALRGGIPDPEDAMSDAVLEPDGRLVHATGEARDNDAREGLIRAVIAMESARGALRKSDPHEAVSIWQGLVDGRWTLIDHHEAGGKRYVLARRNDPAVVDPRSLGLRERQVLAFVALGHSNKLIAYELGLTPSTVASHLTTILQKLKLGSRRELIQMFGSHVLPKNQWPS